MTLHQFIKSRLRAAGLCRLECRAIIATAEIHPDCCTVRRFWTCDVTHLSQDVAPGLWLVVQRIAAEWLLSFAPSHPARHQLDKPDPAMCVP